jgi:hypothetical protein
MLVYGYYVFPKPSVHGFPIAVDPADHSCRYLVQPPTVPSLARLRGYQRPPRGGRGRCRRACERNPSGAAAAAPAPGALITTALAMLPPQCPTVARAGCVAEARSNKEQIARSFDGLPSLVPLFAFVTDFFPKLQADISERVHLLRFAKLAPTFSNRARPESRCFISRLGHGALALLASDPHTSGRLGELRDKFPEH